MITIPGKLDVFKTLFEELTHGIFPVDLDYIESTTTIMWSVSFSANYVTLEMDLADDDGNSEHFSWESFSRD